MKTFTHTDCQRFKKVLEALLPENVQSSVTVGQGGLALSLVLCGPESCKTFQYGPALSENDLFLLSKCWTTGEYVPPDSMADRQALARATPVLSITTRQAFFAWFQLAKPGSRIIYFKGRLAQYRHDAGARLVCLQAMEDHSVPSRPRPTAERIERLQLEEQKFLLSEIDRLLRSGKIEVTQAKLPNDSGSIYFGIKR